MVVTVLCVETGAVDSVTGCRFVPVRPEGLGAALLRRPLPAAVLLGEGARGRFYALAGADMFVSTVGTTGGYIADGAAIVAGAPYYSDYTIGAVSERLQGGGGGAMGCGRARGKSDRSLSRPLPMSPKPMGWVRPPEDLTAHIAICVSC
jgi:hypothetical protein